MRLVGTTKPTIESIRDRSHWNSANLSPGPGGARPLLADRSRRRGRRAAKRLERERAEQGLPPEDSMPRPARCFRRTRPRTKFRCSVAVRTGSRLPSATATVR